MKNILQIPDDKLIVSFIGRFSPEKGIFFLLDIIKIVNTKTDKIFFILSGQEGQIKHADVQKKIDELSMQSFVKIIDRLNDVRDLISITDIGILSSRYSEFICRIAMEFMAFKVSVVAPRLNVIPEVIEDQRTGYIYVINDSNQAAEYILELSDNKELRDKFGSRGFDKMTRMHSLDRFKSEIEMIISKIWQRSQ